LFIAFSDTLQRCKKHHTKHFSNAFSPFGLSEGQIYGEFDLIYILNDMMFWGAKHVDGRSFDRVENRPDNLQIPLIRK
jgi:hypothetical protein